MLATYREHDLPTAQVKSAGADAVKSGGVTWRCGCSAARRAPRRRHPDRAQGHPRFLTWRRPSPGWQGRTRSSLGSERPPEAKAEACLATRGSATCLSAGPI